MENNKSKLKNKNKDENINEQNKLSINNRR